MINIARYTHLYYQPGKAAGQHARAEVPRLGGAAAWVRPPQHQRLKTRKDKTCRERDTSYILSSVTDSPLYNPVTINADCREKHLLCWADRHNTGAPRTNLLSLTAASPAMSSTKEESSGRGWAGLLCGGDEPSWHNMPDPVILHSWERFPGSCTTIKVYVTTQLLLNFVSILFHGLWLMNILTFWI